MDHRFVLTKPADTEAMTVRAQLWGCGFRLGVGILGERYTRERQKYNNPVKGEYLTDDHPILDKEFSMGYHTFGDVPAVAFRDSHYIYFFVQCEGAAWMQRIRYDLSPYLSEFLPTIGDGK